MAPPLHLEVCGRGLPCTDPRQPGKGSYDTIDPTFLKAGCFSENLPSMRTTTIRPLSVTIRPVMKNTLAQDARWVSGSHPNSPGCTWPMGGQPSSGRRGLRPSPNVRPFVKLASKPHRRGQIEKRVDFVRICSLPFPSSLAPWPASTVGLDVGLRHHKNTNLLPTNDLSVKQPSTVLPAKRFSQPAARASSAPDMPVAGIRTAFGFVRICPVLCGR